MPTYNISVQRPQWEDDAGLNLFRKARQENPIPRETSTPTNPSDTLGLAAKADTAIVKRSLASRILHRHDQIGHQTDHPRQTIRDRVHLPPLEDIEH